MGQNVSPECRELAGPLCKPSLCKPSANSTAKDDLDEEFQGFQNQGSYSTDEWTPPMVKIVPAAVIPAPAPKVQASQEAAPAERLTEREQSSLLSFRDDAVPDGQLCVLEATTAPHLPGAKAEVPDGSSKGPWAAWDCCGKRGKEAAVAQRSISGRAPRYSSRASADSVSTVGSPSPSPSPSSMRSRRGDVLASSSPLNTAKLAETFFGYSAVETVEPSPSKGELVDSILQLGEAVESQQLQPLRREEEPNLEVQAALRISLVVQHLDFLELSKHQQFAAVHKVLKDHISDLCSTSDTDVSIVCSAVIDEGHYCGMAVLATVKLARDGLIPAILARLQKLPAHGLLEDVCGVPGIDAFIEPDTQLQINGSDIRGAPVSDPTEVTLDEPGATAEERQLQKAQAEHVQAAASSPDEAGADNPIPITECQARLSDALSREMFNLELTEKPSDAELDCLEKVKTADSHLGDFKAKFDAEASMAMGKFGSLQKLHGKHGHNGHVENSPRRRHGHDHAHDHDHGHGHGHDHADAHAGHAESHGQGRRIIVKSARRLHKESPWSAARDAEDMKFLRENEDRDEGWQDAETLVEAKYRRCRVHAAASWIRNHLAQEGESPPAAHSLRWINERPAGCESLESRKQREQDRLERKLKEYVSTRKQREHLEAAVAERIRSRGCEDNNMDVDVSSPGCISKLVKNAIARDSLCRMEAAQSSSDKQAHLLMNSKKLLNQNDVEEYWPQRGHNEDGSRETRRRLATDFQFRQASL
eukprot:TRINITY_DN5454_c1_g1_i4.p1 TRINITY_DN5454_c1_g1~~TRINITY_DN5454_c1_g1_i4.p1  ORF type:complete len:761 (+),score=154.18 TRINITY_DN5454_c1_g1_i4:149-2431(+)